MDCKLANKHIHSGG